MRFGFKRSNKPREKVWTKRAAPPATESPSESPVPSLEASSAPVLPPSPPVVAPIEKRSPKGLPYAPKSEKQRGPMKKFPILPVLPIGEVSSEVEKVEVKPLPVFKNISQCFETDQRRLEQRQKQIDLGKKTLSYYFYNKKVARAERMRGVHPSTPRKTQVCSKRSWDGQVRKWRRMLHEYDPKTEQEIQEAFQLFPEETSFLVSGMSGLCSLVEYYDVL